MALITSDFALSGWTTNLAHVGQSLKDFFS